MWKTTYFCLVMCAITKVFCTRTGNFKLSDDVVNGDGSYTINNETAEINLHLLIGNILKGLTGQQENIPIIKPTLKKTGDQTKQIEATSTSSERRKGSQAQEPTNEYSASQRQESEDIKVLNQINKQQEPNLKIINSKGQDAKDRINQKQVPNRILELNKEEMSNDDINFAMDGLAEHNKFRKIHDSIELKLDREMCLQAQKFAEQLAKLGTLKHSPRDSRPGQGENLAMGCSSGDSSMSASAASKKWYDEVCNYDFKNNTFQKQCGHFSQIVWKSTDSLGIGKAYGTKWGMNCTFIVARYSPQGNIANFIKDNVEKGAFDLSYCSTAIRSLDKTESNQNQPQHSDYQAEYFRDQYALNEGFLNDEGEGMKSIGYRGKIPRVKPMRIQVL